MKNPELTLDELLKILEIHAHKILIELHQSSLMPIYHLHGDQDIAVGCHWENVDQKLVGLREIKKQAKKINATMIGFVGEAWMTKHDHEVDITQVVAPSKSPYRIEVVIATATDGETTKTKTWQIMRNEPYGVILCLAPMEDELGTQMTFNRMVDGLLPKKGTVH